MQFEEIKALVEKEIPGAVSGEDLASSPSALIIVKEHIKSVCELLHAHDKLYFDSLSCLTGLDNGEENSMEVIYNLYSIPFDLHLALKVILDRPNPEVDSVSEIWRTADWHEREAYDLLGIKFISHPDLRRILLPDDWEGHPLRKDYEEQEKYHDVKVKY
ncbi:NADH-quinone oxidoreductase subunit C [Ekhidna sp.]|uniref:NADH-quinone oxidoreductase subunit C n=1 Tax=Ekhidna sp. TaxID=2608089 RepID=UPI003B508924